MAKATKVVMAPRYSLELSGKEAGVLRSVLMSVAGAPEGLRGVVDAIEGVLEEAGIEPIGECSGHVSFS